ncbi:MAG: dihydroneopterin aldolase [Synechococcaceae cyanobacterium]|nr:dihydroneopterin aldolase [Synechococcaceae cyanobacterium]
MSTSAPPPAAPPVPVPAGDDWIEVNGLRVWAHVGVLEQERRDGQWFEISFRLAADLSAAAREDALSLSCDYVTAITALQQQAATIRCLTLEHYSECILDLLEQCYGPRPLELQLCKCSPPIAGFSGDVRLRRRRCWA